MKVATIISIVILLSISQRGFSATLQSDETTAYRQFLQGKDSLNENTRSGDMQEITGLVWPYTRPYWASRVLSVSEYSSTYEIYMWWQSGYLFGQVVPLNGTDAFICGPGWIMVQQFGDTVSAFDTVSFRDADDTSVCDDYLTPKTFRVTQYSYLFDYYVDYNYPFNLVSSRDASQIILLNGGVLLGSSTSNVGSVSPSLDISIPSLDYNDLGGTTDIWLELQYNGTTPEGDLTWKLDSVGIND